MLALVIDDSKATRMILGQILRQIGFEVADAANGREGFEQLGRLDPHVVLIDWHMPDVNGLEFVRAVRTDARYARLPLMMVTSDDDQGQIRTALEAGANEYIRKPFTKEGIAERLQRLGIMPR